MVVNITGNKYSGSVTTVGNVTRLIHSAAAFSSGDFNVSRTVSLYNSTGAIYKGMAFIRRHISATELELYQAFFNPDGSEVTQVVGDTYQVSKNSAECVTTGWTVLGNTVTLTDRVTFGTLNVVNSVCFHDVGKTFVINGVTNSNIFAFFTISGGLVVLGFLENFASKTYSQPCNILNKNINTGSDGSGGILPNSAAAAKFWMLGGSLIAETLYCYLGGNNDTSGRSFFFFFWGVSTNFDCTVNSSTWESRQSYQQLVNCNIVTNGNNSIAVRWADGLIADCIIKLLGSDCISVFGNDSEGTFFIENSGTKDIIVSDAGTTARQALWRSGGDPIQNITYINVVASNRKHGRGGDPGIVPNPNTMVSFKFRRIYTNLVNGTLGLVRQANLGSAVVSNAIAASGSVSLTVQEAVVVGHTETVTENSWVAALLLYGYQLITQFFSTSFVVLSAGQTGKTVIFGSVLAEVALQIIDINITQLTAATVAAYTTLEITDKVYDFFQYWKALNITNAIYPSVPEQVFSVVNGKLTSTTQNIILDSAIAASTASAGTATIKTSALTAGIKTSRFQLAASKTLTFAQNGDKSAIGYDIPSTGIVGVAGGSTNLQKSIFTSGATINNTSAISAVVTVDSTVGIATTSTGGGAITLSAPQPTILFNNIPIAGTELRIYNPDTNPNTDLAGLENSTLSNHSLTYAPGTFSQIRVQIIFPPGTFEELNLIFAANSNQSVSVSSIAIADRNFLDEAN